MSKALTWITTPFGLLDLATQQALRTHGGPYEYWNHRCQWEHTDQPAYDFRTVYRVKPSPKVETFSMAVFIDREGFIQPSHLKGLTRRVHVNFTSIDGEIDLNSYRVSPR